MTRPLYRLLSDSNTATGAPPETTAITVDSDFVVLLAALLCALICVLGLVAVTRCAWLRRLSSSSGNSGGAGSAPPNPSPPAAVANKGLKKKVLKSLPKEIYSADTPSAAKFAVECAICLAEFVEKEELRVLPQCGHVFHVACIDTWLGSHSSCPSCRQILAVARCQKCGGIPAAPAASGGSSSGTETENRFKEREDAPNSFLP